MRDRFLSTFQSTRDGPPAAVDLRRIKQQPGETLQKYIQRFNGVRLKMPKVTGEAIKHSQGEGHPVSNRPSHSDLFRHLHRNCWCHWGKRSERLRLND